MILLFVIIINIISCDINHITWIRLLCGFVAVCALIDEGCVAVIGPTQHEAHRTAQEISGRLQVPFFARTHSTTSATGDADLTCSTCFHLLPPSRTLSRAFADILKAKKWKNYALIYEKNQGIYSSRRELHQYLV